MRLLPHDSENQIIGDCSVNSTQKKPSVIQMVVDKSSNLDYFILSAYTI